MRAPGFVLQTCVQSAKSGDRWQNSPIAYDCNIMNETRAARIAFSRPLETPPFWRCLPDFFAFPLGGEPLERLILLSLGALFAIFLPLPRPFDFLVMGAVIVVIYLRFAFKVLERTAYGIMDPADYANSIDDGQKNSPYRLLACYILLALPVMLAAAVGKNAMQTMQLLTALALPAVTMNLAIHHRLSTAIDPRMLWRTMTSIGWPYLALWFFVETLGVGSVFVAGKLASWAPRWLAPSIFAFIAMYFGLVAYRMMGYALFQYHESLGIEVVAPADDTAESQAEASPGSMIGRQVAAAIGLGQWDEAKALAYAEQLERPGGEACDRYHRLLKLTGDIAQFLSYGRDYMLKLIDSGQANRALPVFIRCREVDPEFRCTESSQVMALALAAYRMRKYDLGLTIMNRFDRCFPGDPAIPDVYLLSARILSEHKNQDALARQILTASIARFPHHAGVEDARRMIEFIDRLQQVGARS